MVQKLDIKTLAGKYKNFNDPHVKVLASGQEITVSDDLYLEMAEVNSGVGREPDMAVLVYQASKIGTKGISSIEGRLNVGEKIEIRAGYGVSLTRIFLGYLHEVKAACYRENFVEYTLICLDVKGLMKKNSSFQVSGKKKIQQILDDIFSTGTYSFLVEKKNQDSIPSGFNQDCVIRGDTHYDWLCNLSEYLDYEFYCCRGELNFRKAQKDTAAILELSREYGLQAVSTVVSMAGQTGGVQVNGYNRKDEKISGSRKRTTVPGPFLQKLNRTLQGCEKVIWEMELETGEQAKARAQAVMDRDSRQCSRMEAVNIGIPELLPGVCVKIMEKNVTSLSGTVYIEEVTHLLDGKGYRTVIRGVRQ